MLKNTLPIPYISLLLQCFKHRNVGKKSASLNVTKTEWRVFEIIVQQAMKENKQKKKGISGKRLV